MRVVCSLCSKSDARKDCYVRVETQEHPACRPCWEQLLLDPRRILRAIQEGATRLRFSAPSAS
ncbi:MAG: hypothetical protein HY293_11650 [Planctomycetes bacterium]|nr:hypothetical protein [Planctomycetota bacterium]